MPHDPIHRTQHIMVVDTCKAIANGRKSRGRPRKCEALLGCTCECLVRRLGVQPGDTREWDHIIPLSQGGGGHFTNYQLLTAEDHRAKPRVMSPEIVAAQTLLQLRYPSSIRFA